MVREVSAKKISARKKLCETISAGKNFWEKLSVLCFPRREKYAIPQKKVVFGSPVLLMSNCSKLAISVTIFFTLTTPTFFHLCSWNFTC